MTTAASSVPVDPAQRLQFFQHIPALDGLRGIAILLVLVQNAGHFGAHPSGAFWVTALIAAIGWVGVQLFFVLSGFLITVKLLETQSASNYFSVFFGRRVLRIFPLYYAALIVGLLIGVLPTGVPRTWRSCPPRRSPDRPVRSCRAWSS